MSDAPSGIRFAVRCGGPRAEPTFEAVDEAGRRAWFVAGSLGARPTAEVVDASGAITHRLESDHRAASRRIVVLGAGGRIIGSIRARTSPYASRMVVDLSDGPEWTLGGNLIEKDYAITSGGAVVASISQAVRATGHCFTLDVADAVDQGLVLATLWAVDAFREQRWEPEPSAQDRGIGSR